MGIKVGIIGIGNMGKSYALTLDQGLIAGAELSAVCGRNTQQEWVTTNLKAEVKFFDDENAFFNEAKMDALLIATPHYSHPELAMKAFAKGMHVLLEKPAGVFTKNVIEMNQAAAKSGKVFSMMFNQRTNPLYQKLRNLILAGELGEIKRTNWIITDWYRSQSYYDSSHWRATWKGEGGGVLLNQAPHQLDLWQWTTGLEPKRVHGFCHNGKYHDIEVEDDVTAYVEYENGATGVFIASTGEAPGTNRFEIQGDRGKIVVENNALTFYRLTQSEREFNATYKGGFGKPECWTIDIPVAGENTAHQGIIQNWIDAITKGTPLLAPGEEGIKGVELANAIYLSSWLNQTIELPVNPDFYYEKLQEKINQSVKNYR
ncbi:Gfo/Idh/MocA family protein [Neobacillus dielmonensis]|uniref:Gfo/Idh/MocA family protein n=1 Tax=Neobacillus dielmonensis TaxID=1347369 RepID=UPI0005A7F51F|nr:Gfo/Idh/MocA family oxidoreductase [Neobacillus dielmonensis]